MTPKPSVVAGVDEAGRGCVLGPLVIAAVSFDISSIPELVSIGVKDSKLLSRKKRSELFRKIRRLAEGTSVWKINPREIDAAVTSGERLFRLNYLEAKYMARALGSLSRWNEAYVDCCDTDENRFGALVSELMGRVTRGRHSSRGGVRSEHHADANHPVVSAASIVAKVTRDAHIAQLQRRHGPFGSGYPSDGETIGYLRGLLSRSESLPEFARLSWDTVRRLREDCGVGRIDDYAS